MLFCRRRFLEQRRISSPLKSFYRDTILPPIQLIPTILLLLILFHVQFRPISGSSIRHEARKKFPVLPSSVDKEKAEIHSMQMTHDDEDRLQSANDQNAKKRMKPANDDINGHDDEKRRSLLLNYGHDEQERNPLIIGLDDEKRNLLLNNGHDDEERRSLLLNYGHDELERNPLIVGLDDEERNLLFNYGHSDKEGKSLFTNHEESQEKPSVKRVKRESEQLMLMQMNQRDSSEESYLDEEEEEEKADQDVDAEEADFYQQVPPPAPFEIPPPPAHSGSASAGATGPNTDNICNSDGTDLSDSLIWMESADNLIPLIRNKQKYNMFLAPGQLHGKTTTVSVAVYIESMSSFKAQTMDFEVDMYLAMSWFDRRLAHNCSHPILIAQKKLADRIWHPDLYFVNSKFAYLQEVTTPNFMLLVYPDGFVFNSMRVDVTLSCMMHLSDYPMDTQTCPINIQSYAYIENVLNLTWHEDIKKGFPIGSNDNIKLNDMKITDKNWEWCGGPYPMFRGTGHWSCIKAHLVMERLVMFHVIQTYIPTGMLVMISWLSFWLDPRAGPARISLTITTLLTLTTMSNSARQDLPQVSYIKALDIWLSVCTAFVFCVLLEYTLVSCFISVKTSHCQHIRIVRKLANNCGTPLLTNRDGVHRKAGADHQIKFCGYCAHKWEKSAKRVDKFSRAGFPTLFALFSIVYWIYYMAK